LWLLVAAFLGFSLPLYVKTFQHYLLLPLPFGVVLAVYVWEKLADTRWRFGVLLALGLMAASSGLRGSWQASFLWEQRGERTKQSELAKALNERIPRGTAVLLLPTHAQAMNYLAGFRPVDPKGSGYAFPSSFDETYFRELLQASPPVITDEGQRLSVPWQEELMQAAGYELVGEVGGLEIWEVR
jgi:4-amino-4-deoxy-L-arabinose transferase-like glycosyltransferase